ncbi:MAG: NAD-dependent epimerase/dehydratase family protein [Saprospiraceae bacterium]
MRVLLTGADGMLGSHIARELLRRNSEVRAFLLPGANHLALEGVEVERVPGNILNYDEVLAAAKGCDYVVHVAANTNVWPSRSEMVRRVNIDGTRHMIKAAKAVGVSRFVHIGSASSFGLGAKHAPGDETTPFNGWRYGLDYVDSKYEAQQILLREVAEIGFPAIVVAPTFMFGPYDTKPGSGQMIIAVRQRKVPAFAGGGKNFVHVNDVATAAVNALTMGRTGESYIAGHENLSYREAMQKIASVVQVPPPRVQVPDLLLKTAGLLGSALGTAKITTPKLSYPMALVACDGQYFSSAKAVAELNMPQTDISIAIREAFEWFVAHGYC